MDSNPILHLSPAKEMKCSFLYYVQLLMIGWAGQWTQTPSTTPLQPKQWNAHFCITFNIWCWPDWSMDLNLIHHPSPAKKMKCSFFDYVQLLMISWAGQWTWTPSAIPLQPIKWNATFWITFNFWWSAGLVNGLKPHLHLSPAKEMKCYFLVYVQLLMISWAGRWTETPFTTPLQPKKWNAHFWITFTSDDWPGWSMDSNPILHLSPAEKMKCSFFYYVQLLMIGWAGRWTQTPSTTPLHPKKWNAHFWITFNFWWLARLVNGLKLPLPSLSSQKHEMLLFGLRSTSDDSLGWSMDSNPIHHPSPAKKVKCSFLYYIQHLMLARLVNGLEPHPPLLSSQKMKCSFLGYIQLLVISCAVRWTQTPSATPLQPIKWNAHFWITFNFWWSAGLVNGLEPHPPPVSRQKNKMLIFWLCSTSDVGQTGQWTWTPSTTLLQPIKWNARFWIMFNFWWSAGLVNGLKPHLPALSSQ